MTDLSVQYSKIGKSIKWFLFFLILIGGTLTNTMAVSAGPQIESQKQKTKTDSGKSKPLKGYDRSVDVDSLNLPNFVDGPHVFWEDSSRIKVWYVNHSQRGNTMEVKTKRIKVKKDSLLLKWNNPDVGQCWIHKRDRLIPYEFSGVERIMAVGDVHGEYDDLVRILKSNKVVDDDLNWNWKDGHLVFVGDIFDRGSKVTECLWLIRKLSQQALKEGGRVHCLLGNHEIMILMSDSRYVAPKYKNMCKRLMMNYYSFYSHDSELGRWLRGLNCVVKINDMIFVHAGLSPMIVERDLDIDKINKDVHFGLKYSEKLTPGQLMNTLFYPQNPMWYRGYLVKTRSYPKITQEELDNVLTHFNASNIIFGHTEVNKIRPLYQNKIFAINVPFGVTGIEGEMLMIKDGCFYRVNMDGSQELIGNN